MSTLDYEMEDEALFLEEDEGYDEDYDEYFAGEEDEAYGEDEYGERRRRPRRRPPNIRAGRTARGRGFVRPTPSKQPVSTATLQASLERVGKDIRTNAAAIKRLAGQVKSATGQLNKTNTTQDRSIDSLRKDLRNQQSAAQQQNQLNMLIPLLQKGPALEAIPGRESSSQEILGSVRIKNPDNTMMLLMMMMMGSNQGGGANNGMNNMLPLLLLTMSGNN